MKTIILCLISFSAILSGCYYDNEENVYPKIVSSTCDTLNINYVKNIEPLLNQYCTSCHGVDGSGGISLNSYDLVKASAERVYGSIAQLSGYSPMPQNGNKLTDCKTRMVRIWIDSNMPY